MAHQLTRKMRNTAYSFRRLSKMEAKDIRPYAVRVEKVQNSISVREMSSRMMLLSHKEDWLRVLNSNIRGSSYIKQGEMIKLIV